MSDVKALLIVGDLAELIRDLPALWLENARGEGTSLHAQALADAGVPDAARSDRELVIELLRRSTQGDQSPRLPRWARVPLAHGSGVRQALLRAAGLDPDEVTGWDGEGNCPVCGREDEDEGRDVRRLVRR